MTFTDDCIEIGYRTVCPYMEKEKHAMMENKETNHASIATTLFMEACQKSINYYFSSFRTRKNY